MAEYDELIGRPGSFRLLGKYPLGDAQVSELKRLEPLVNGIPLEPLCRGNLFANDPDLSR
jgi:hypothetical protein